MESVQRRSLSGSGRRPPPQQAQSSADQQTPGLGQPPAHPHPHPRQGSHTGHGHTSATLGDAPRPGSGTAGGVGIPPGAVRRHSAAAVTPAQEAFDGEPIAAKYKRGVRLEQRKMFGKAAALYRECTERGFAKAMINLAGLHDRGLGCEESPEVAVHLLQRAYQQRSSMAAFRLFAHAHQGRGMPQDKECALQYLLDAANNNLAIAQYNLALMWERGRIHRSQDGSLHYLEKPGPPDLRAAEDLYTRSANQGYNKARVNLGLLMLRTSAKPSPAPPSSRPETRDHQSSAHNWATPEPDAIAIARASHAQELLLEAAESGDALGMWNLGMALKRSESLGTAHGGSGSAGGNESDDGDSGGDGNSGNDKDGEGDNAVGEAQPGTRTGRTGRRASAPALTGDMSTKLDADRWIERAAEKGVNKARYNVAMQILRGLDDDVGDGSPEHDLQERRELHERALSYLNQCADAGDARGAKALRVAARREKEQKARAVRHKPSDKAIARVRARVRAREAANASAASTPSATAASTPVSTSASTPTATAQHGTT